VSAPSAVACRLSDRIVLLMVRLGEPHEGELGRVVLDDDDQTIELDGRWLDCSTTKPGLLMMGTGLLPAGITLGELRRLGLPGADVELPLSDDTDAPEHFVRAAGLRKLGAPARARIQAFLAATPGEHGIGLGTELAGNLAALRAEVRRGLPSSTGETRAPAATLDSITAIDAYGFWLTGSLDAALAAGVRLAAVSPEGWRVEIEDGAVTFEANADDQPEIAYQAYIELEHPSRHRHGWVMEFRTPDGRALEHATPEPRVTNVEWVWDRVLAQLSAHAGEESVSARQIAPALRRLRAQAPGAARSGSLAEGRRRPAGTPIIELRVEPAAETEATAALLTAPVKRSRSPYADTYSFAIRGWALPEHGVPATLEARDPTGRVHRTAANLPIPRAPVRYRETDGAEHAGFQFILSAVPMPVEFVVDIALVAADGTRRQLGQVRGRRRPLVSSYTPAIQPLLVTTIGRSGSTWLVALLAQHPEIVAMRPFAYEPNLTSYWAEVLRTLADPASYMMSLQPQINHERWWLGDHRPTPLPASKPFPEMPRWLGSANVENLASIYQMELDSFYDRVRQFEGRRSARYFVEKTSPGLTPRLVSELYPDGREILLVRDFRDTALSIIDYNAKRGLNLWGRDRADTEAEWLQYLRGEIGSLIAGLHERGDRVHVVRYEDLVASPVETLTGAFAYAGLAHDPGQARRAVVAIRQTERHRQEAHRTASSFAASVGRWREQLSDESRAAYAEAFDDLLAEFGYEPTV
jgi:hypothetical protein